MQHAAAAALPSDENIWLGLQKESPLDAHLHGAALQGDADTLRRVLDTGRVHVDCKDKVKLNSCNSR